MRTRLVSLAAAAAMTLTAIGGSATLAGGAPTRMVDDDGRATTASCSAGAPGSASTTIQEAIDAAPDGATILVCPGTYVEQIEVSGVDGLTIRSTRPWAATIQAPNSLDFPAIVGIYGADDITFRGFRVITRSTPDCDDPSAGILVLAARNAVVRGNRVRNFGATMGACAFSVGIAIGFSSSFLVGGASTPAGLPSDLTTTATVAYNAVQDHLFVGIAAVSTSGLMAGGSSGPTRATIANNSVRYIHKNVGIDSCLTPVSLGVARSDVRAARTGLAGLLPAGPMSCFGVGIYLGSGVENSPIPGASGVIRDNRVLSGPNAEFVLPVADPGTPLQLVGIAVVDQRHKEGSTVVSGNRVFRNAIDILALDAAGLDIRRNRTTHGFVGIAIADTEGARVRGNVAADNLVGIATETIEETSPGGLFPEDYVTSDILFRNNDARGNFDLSCEDPTLGSGSQGTANTWTDNLGEAGSSDPAGICGAIDPF